MSHTKDEKYAFVFTWSIVDFNFFVKKALFSPWFVPQSVDQGVWTLMLIQDTEEGKNITFSLRRKNSTDASLDIHCVIDILIADGSQGEILLEKKLIRTSTSTDFIFLKSVDIRNFFQKKEFGFRSHNVVTIRCRMKKSNVEILRELFYCYAQTNIGTEKLTSKIRIPHLSKPSGSNTSLKIEPITLNVCFSTSSDSIKFTPWLYTRKKKLLISCTVSVMDYEMKKTLSTTDEHLFFGGESRRDIWNFPLCLSKSTLLENRDIYLPDDALILLLDITFSTGTQWEELTYDTQSDQSVIASEEPPYSLKSDLLNLYSEKDLCDFTFVAATGEEFPVHKAIISSRSIVFRAMMNKDMKEKFTSSATLPDLDSDTLNRLLIFAYTDKLDHLTFDSAFKLYVAADQYEMLSLKQKCSKFLKSVLSVSNICDIIGLADRHQDTGLKRAARDYVFINKKEVVQSEKWKLFFETQVFLAAEILQEMVKSKLKIQDSVLES